MQTKTRFDRLPKRDREEVRRIDALQASWAASPEEYASIGLRRFFDDQKNLHGKSVNGFLAGELFFLQSYCCDLAITRRFLNDDVTQLRMGVDTAARLGLLKRMIGGPGYSGGYDCLHVLDLIWALAVEDKPLVNAFLSNFSVPFRSGHPTTVLLANGVYAVLCEDRTTFANLEQRIREKSESNFFRAMFDCLLAIMADDASLVATAIGELLKWNRRQVQINSSMQKLICLTAHAFYNLCRRIFVPRGIAMPEIPDESTWDGEFQNFVQSSEGGDVFFDFSQVNPVLAEWMKELPATVNIEDLLAHVS